MAKIEKFVCDRTNCKEEAISSQFIQIYSHSTPDASGNGSDDRQACAHLCPRHLLQFTQFLIGLIEDGKIPKKLTDIFEKFNIKSELL